MLVGAGLETTAVALDVAVAEPAEFVAVTATRSVAPRSSAVSVYVEPDALGTAVHAAPLELQRCHWYAYVIGCTPVQTPVEACSSEPGAVPPEIVGGSVFVGRERATFFPRDFVVVVPDKFRAVTTTLRVPSRSRSVGR
jgi:hypothetical protein